MFFSFLTHLDYGWGEFCVRALDEIPSQICFEWSMPKPRPMMPYRNRRPFTKAELQRLFDHIDDLVDREYAAGSKR